MYTHYRRARKRESAREVYSTGYRGDTDSVFWLVVHFLDANRAVAVRSILAAPAALPRRPLRALCSRPVMRAHLHCGYDKARLWCCALEGDRCRAAAAKRPAFR